MFFYADVTVLMVRMKKLFMIGLAQKRTKMGSITGHNIG